MDKLKESKLKEGLNRRHVYFIALGSAIGTGLFYGSAKAIQLAGPSVLLAYFIAGVAAFMVMRALGEMAVRDPLPGSFGSYATNYISPLAGFITGWTYIFEMALVCLADITAFAVYMHVWYPDVSPWIWTLGITLIITGINLTAVKVFGEMEFWLSIIKIATIIIMIVVGIGIILFGFGVSSSVPTGIHNLWAHSGWLPNGWGGFIAAFSVVVFAFGGIEIIGLTAVETKNSEKNIPKAINAIPFRILFFYVMTLGILMAIFPWNEIGLSGSPFVIVFKSIGLPYAADIMNVVVITAAISAINSDLYGACRMIHGMALKGHAFKQFKHLSSDGIPIVAVWAMFVFLIFGVIMNYYYHDELFFMIAAMATFATVLVWLMILASQWAMRMKMSKSEAKKLKFPIPFWPIAPIFTILFMIFIIALLGVFPETRMALYVGFVWVILLVVSFGIIKKFQSLKK